MSRANRLRLESSHLQRVDGMFFSRNQSEPIYLSRSDDGDPLSSFSPHGFHLDDADWPSVEHYYQAMKFEDPAQRETIRCAPSPTAARELAGKHRKAVRKDWKGLKDTVMTRGIYIKCRTHPEVAALLLRSDGRKLVESSQFDYYWGCGRDGRGRNSYGKVLMAVREKLNAERLASS